MSLQLLLAFLQFKTDTWHLHPDSAACLQGAYLWNWKDKIDRAWMAKYGENLPAMEEEPLPHSGVSPGEVGMAAVLASAQMRCGGCGAKAGSNSPYH